MGLLTDSRAGAGDGQRSDWGRHARTRSFDTLPADSGHLGPEGTPRAPLHTHTRTHSSVAHTRSRPRVRGRQTKRVSGRADEGGGYTKAPLPVVRMGRNRAEARDHASLFTLYLSTSHTTTFSFSSSSAYVRPDVSHPSQFYPGPGYCVLRSIGFLVSVFYFFCPFLFLCFSGSKFLPFVCRVSSRTLRSQLLWCCAAPPLPPLLG